MTNLTLSIDDTLLREVRARALREGTSINACVREFLAAYAGEDNRQQQAGRDFIAAARRSKASSRGVTWSREELHERHPK